MYDRVLDRFTNELGFNNFKMECSEFGGFMGYHNPDTFLDEPNIQKLCARLSKTNGTLALDIGQPGTASHRVEKYAEWVEKYPDTKFVFCHLLSMTPGHAEALKREIALLDKPNVWYDLAAIACNTAEHAPYTQAREYLRIARDEAGAERLLWGSDAPTTLFDYPYREAQDIVAEAGLFTAEELEASSAGTQRMRIPCKQLRRTAAQPPINLIITFILYTDPENCKRLNTRHILNKRQITNKADCMNQSFLNRKK
jgi:predicted TIM-barrel fold metal-dependent hydrolase